MLFPNLLRRKTQSILLSFFSLILLSGCSDNDLLAPPTQFTLNINSPVESIIEGQALTIRITLDREAPQAFNGIYEIAGSATKGTDFIGISGVYVFAPGDQSITFTSNIINDGLMEGQETIVLSLSQTGLPQGINLGESASITITVWDK